MRAGEHRRRAAHRRARLVACALTAGTAVGSLAPATAVDQPTSTPQVAAVSRARPVLRRFDWRSVFNFYRATAGLAPVKEVGSWSRGARLHARYIARNRYLSHAEDPSRPWYTSAGDAAGRNGNVSMSTGPNPDWNDRAEIEGWMAAPFHAAGMIDAALRRTGYGRYVHRRDGAYTQGATVDVIRGRSGSVAREPVLWPADGMQVPLRTYSGNEWPDPTSSCKGYSGDVGLPIIAMFPHDVRVRDSSFSSGGSALGHCAFDGHTYRNPNAATQRRGRDVLLARNTVVLIPRAPLKDFQAYTAHLQTDRGDHVSWTFTVGEVEPPHDPDILASRVYQENPNFGVAWTAQDEESGIAAFDVRWRRAPVDGDFTPWASWLDRAATSSSTFAGEPGSTYCFKARAYDRGGNRSGWSPERCTTVPVRAIDMESAPLWIPLADPGYYAGSGMMAVLPGSTLVSDRVRARRVALIATREPGSGRVEVLWNGTRLGIVDLDAPDVRHRLQIELAIWRHVRTGRLTVRVLEPGTRVVIEGVGASRR